MKVVIFLLSACVVGSYALDCSTKYNDFHKCVSDARKKSNDDEKAKRDALKEKIDGCYKINQCTPPQPGANKARGGGGNKGGANSECRNGIRDAIKQDMETCVKKAIPGFVFPQEAPGENREGRGGWNHREGNQGQDTCKNKQAVRDCIRGAFSSIRPTDAEKRARFQASCDAKTKCLAAMSSECRTQKEQFVKAACDCKQHQDEGRIRSSVKACQGMDEHKGTRPPTGRAQEPCGVDYCKNGGYDQFVKDHPRRDGHH